MDNKFLNEKIAWALTPEANECLNDLCKLGIDKDLALTVMEELLPCSTIYQIDNTELKDILTDDEIVF
jgi:hypothetical protein